MIQPYQYMNLCQVAMHQINIYQTVNDASTVQTTQVMTANKVKELVPEPLAEELLKVILDRYTTRAKMEKVLTAFKENVEPFKEPSGKQVEKAFRKVKKLHLPDFQQMDLKEHTFLGWNDPGTQRKYLLYYDDHQKLQGLYGTMSPNVLKNICAICHKESAVAMFLATTKTGGDGTYTKKGNYICTDSEKCNRQLYSREEFDEFVDTIK